MMSKNCLLVTIAIPTYNRAGSYLMHSLGSAVKQTYPNLEIIVSDNCSEDDTGLFVESFNDTRIRYFRQKENIGANNNINFCVDQARGDYILLLCDDDMIDDDLVETCMKGISDSTDIGIVRTGTRVIDSEGDLMSESPNLCDGLSTEEFFRKWFAHRTGLYLCSTLFNTRRLREAGGFHSIHNLFQDVLAETRLAAMHGRLDIPDVKASFRVHPSGITYNVHIKRWCEDSLFLLDKMCDLVTENKALIRKEGMYYFSTFNYKLACGISSPVQRLRVYLIILKSFKGVFLHQILYKLFGRSLILLLRLIKRTISLNYSRSH